MYVYGSVPSFYFLYDINPNTSTETTIIFRRRSCESRLKQKNGKTILLFLSLPFSSSPVSLLHSITIHCCTVYLCLFATGRSAQWRSSTGPCIVLKASRTSRCRLRTQRRVSWDVWRLSGACRRCVFSLWTKHRLYHQNARRSIPLKSSPR